jgi:ATP-dependent DNA ligase
VGGKDIREKPLLERKKILKALLPRGPLLLYSAHVAEFGTWEFAKAQRAHEEGVFASRLTQLGRVLHKRLMAAFGGKADIDQRGR